MLAGNTSDKTTLGDFLAKIEKQYGKADRNIPTEETLAQMRRSSPPASYLAGTPKGRLTALEKDFLALLNFEWVAGSSRLCLGMRIDG